MASRWYLLSASRVIIVRDINVELVDIGCTNYHIFSAMSMPEPHDLYPYLPLSTVRSCLCRGSTGANALLYTDADVRDVFFVHLCSLTKNLFVLYPPV